MSKTKKNQLSLKLCSLFLLLFFFSVDSKSQSVTKLIADCTITYSVSIEGNEHNSTIKTLFIKGKKIRTDISYSSFTQSTIFDNKTGNAVVLKSIGSQKYISSFTAEQWKEKNDKWDDLKVTFTDEAAKILNYNCRKAVVTTKNGNRFVVYYTTDLVASATENPYQFKNIPGLIMEYESQTGEGKPITFKAIEINFNPVPTSKFEIPTTGYRVL